MEAAKKLPFRLASGDAPKNNVLFGVLEVALPSVGERAGNVLTGADGMIIGHAPEAVGVGGVEAVACGETEDGGADEPVLGLACSEDGGWWSVIGGCATCCV